MFHPGFNFCFFLFHIFNFNQNSEFSFRVFLLKILAKVSYQPILSTTLDFAAFSFSLTRFNIIPTVSFSAFSNSELQPPTKSLLLEILLAFWFQYYHFDYYFYLLVINYGIFQLPSLCSRRSLNRLAIFLYSVGYPSLLIHLAFSWSLHPLISALLKLLCVLKVIYFTVFCFQPCIKTPFHPIFISQSKSRAIITELPYCFQ